MYKNANLFQSLPRDPNFTRTLIYWRRYVPMVAILSIFSVKFLAYDTPHGISSGTRFCVDTACPTVA